MFGLGKVIGKGLSLAVDVVNVPVKVADAVLDTDMAEVGEAVSHEIEEAGKDLDSITE